MRDMRCFGSRVSCRTRRIRSDCRPGLIADTKCLHFRVETPREQKPAYKFVKCIQIQHAKFKKIYYPNEKNFGFPLDKKEKKLYNDLTEPRKYRKENIRYEKVRCSDELRSVHEDG